MAIKNQFIDDLKNDIAIDNATKSLKPITTKLPQPSLDDVKAFQKEMSTDQEPDRHHEPRQERQTTRVEPQPVETLFVADDLLVDQTPQEALDGDTPEEDTKQNMNKSAELQTIMQAQINPGVNPEAVILNHQPQLQELTRNDTSERVYNVAKIAEKMVDQILISDPSSSKQIIKLKLKNDVLPNTEVEFERLEGRIAIRLSTSSDEAKELLTDKGGELEAYLQEKLEDELEISFKFEDELF